jgi:ketosteroid isomerase-like protein
MEDQSNVQVVRGVFDAFGKGDMEAVGNALADDIVWRWPGRHPLAGDRHSKGELFKLLGQLAEETSGTERVEIRDIAGGDENVIVLVTVQAERHGKTLTTDGVQVWRVENGKAVEVVDLSYDPYAMDDFFS